MTQHRINIVERLRFDAARCEATFSKGVAGNIEEAADEIERLREICRTIRSQCHNLPSSGTLDEIERLAVSGYEQITA